MLTGTKRAALSLFIPLYQTNLIAKLKNIFEVSKQITKLFVFLQAKRNNDL
jgi:hypothetical protein